MNLPAKQRTVLDLIEEYEAKDSAITEAVANLEKAWAALEMAASVQGTFVESIGTRPYIHESKLRSCLLKSAWKAIYNRLQIDMLASAKDKKLFDVTLQKPPELTFDNAKATFGDYLMRPRYHILRGLAEVFADLDPAYKSHSKVKIGVKGLPKRVIINWGSYSHSYGKDKFRDIVNALAAYQGKPLMEYAEFTAISVMLKTGDAVLDGRTVEEADRYGKTTVHQSVDRGLTVRTFSNGNAHIFFSPDTLLDINRALAEFYGEVLPDVEDEDAKPQAGTAVSKDLQFYASPEAVIKRAIDAAGILNLREWKSNAPAPRKILEPSCGDGRIMDALRAMGHDVTGFEVHAGRAAEARLKGHAVVCANFLEQPAKPEFDNVVMNPPFYGRHYVKHVQHALKFLKPGGVLVAILPATAHYDHKELEGEWMDLPVGSFSESGTNVPTGILKIRTR